MPENKEYKVRILNANEFSRPDLIEIFSRHKSLVPNPLVTNIYVGENEKGRIVGIAVLQPQYHLEPIEVETFYRDTALHKDLIDAAINSVKEIKGLRIWAFSPNNKIANLAMRFGFKLKNYEVFVREF